MKFLFPGSVLSVLCFNFTPLEVMFIFLYFWGGFTACFPLYVLAASGGPLEHKNNKINGYSVTKQQSPGNTATEILFLIPIYYVKHVEPQS